MPKYQPLLFCLFLSMDLVAVVGIVLIMLAIGSTSNVYTPV